jgi:hypothetical protein
MDRGERKETGRIGNTAGLQSGVRSKISQKPALCLQFHHKSYPKYSQLGKITCSENLVKI